MRYAKANASMPFPDIAEQRVIFLGDSITDNWKLDEYFPGEGFINRGIGGQVTEQMLARLRQDVIALNPSIVCFLGGTNDIALGYSNEAILSNIRSIAKQCRESGIRLIISSILPISNYHKDREARRERSKLRPPARILALNDGLRAIAVEEDADYLDLHTVLVDSSGQMPADFSSDGLHPNSKAYGTMAPYILDAIGSVRRQRFNSL
ncbi:GDSL-type esterase/lipase family protein [Coraliomargarita algicola]|uniref:GDSL-type esterase/lipase family protein n=1 Tax=Coraliomargarita algicola TaxID=3092156 RepID=A0ABZ0RQR2_9BACT|nr:GDSL-type esterase/lipase family protein [Coraliomargarita sp. J2-16]WPJ97842.1 GDSL-type esterase/lipase family protein [Coraliomargarita sp. J2-16]